MKCKQKQVALLLLNEHFYDGLEAILPDIRALDKLQRLGQYGDVKSVKVLYMGTK